MFSLSLTYRFQEVLLKIIHSSNLLFQNRQDRSLRLQVISRCKSLSVCFYFPKQTLKGVYKTLLHLCGLRVFKNIFRAVLKFSLCSRISIRLLKVILLVPNT